MRATDKLQELLDQIEDWGRLPHRDVVRDTAMSALVALERRQASLSAFRDGANALAVEAGVIPEPRDASGSVLQDEYYRQLLAEVQLRLNRLSRGYERLRVVAINAADSAESGMSEQYLDAHDKLREVLRDDLTR